MHRGVYLVGALPPPLANEQAALLACGDTASISHWSAASFWRFRRYPAAAYPWVTVPKKRTLVRPRIVIRRSDVDPRDLRKRNGLVLTSPPRTVLDCSILFTDEYELEAFVAEANFTGLARFTEIATQVRRNEGKHGLRPLRRVLDLPGGPRRTLSQGERAFLRLLRTERIEGWDTNSKVFGPRLDFVWPELRFAVELDGWDGHSDKVAFERDRLKIAKLQAIGVEIMPVTGKQLRMDYRGVVERLLAALRIQEKNAA